MIDKSFLSKFKLGNLASTHDLSAGIVKTVEKAEKGEILAKDFPYNKKMGRKQYESAKRKMQVELVKMQNWIRETGQKLVLVFEGRDAAGKGGTIKRFMEHLNPRYAKVVALTKPSELEGGQWYLQRYAKHLPSSGEITLFDRSWYNRAGVEKVMGFCTGSEYQRFLREIPALERQWSDNGIPIVKFWFSVSREEQLRRILERAENPLKQWKLSPIDFKSLGKWADYTKAKEAMIAATGTKTCPWVVIKSDDKKRARLQAIRYVLDLFDYDSKDKKNLCEIDDEILSLTQS
jgi:polyphosphate kinase 2